jgi:predicted membrane channel-forming protein YqfA (hemolysin III family)
MRYVNLLLAAMFLVFASLQLNDPDPITWILIYGTMAVVCVMAAFRYYIRWLMIVQFVCYGIYAIILIPAIRTWLDSPDRSLLFDDLAKMQFPYIEESREFLGLLICITVLVLCWVRSSKRFMKAL